MQERAAEQRGWQRADSSNGNQQARLQWRIAGDDLEPLHRHKLDAAYTIPHTLK